MKSITGDLLSLGANGELDVIIHGCNCFCTMGAGIAKSIKQRFPSAFEVDRKTEKGSRDKLGTISCASIECNGHLLTVVNAYTQFNWRGRGMKADYDAIRSAFQRIKHQFTGQRIGYPMIGAGLAGGDWEFIAAIIDEELSGEDHTLIVYQP